MADNAAAVLRDDRVERVSRLHVGQVGPGAEDLERPQLAAMLVRNDVVRIVGTRRMVAKAADRPSWNRPRSQHSEGSVGAGLRPAEHALDVLHRHRTHASGERPDTGVRRHREVLDPDAADVALYLVVAERPEETARDRNRARGRARMIPAVEGEEPDLTFLVPDREPGRGARRLRPDDRPAPGRGPINRVGAARQLGDRNRSGVHAVREPARVRHFVDRIQVLRPNVRRGVAGPREQVRQEVGGQIDIPFLDFRRVLRLRLTRDWIVVVEPWRRAACGKWEQPRDRWRGRRERASVCACQNAALEANTSFQPSEPRAASSRRNVYAGR